MTENYFNKGKIDKNGFSVIGILVQNEMFGDEPLDTIDIANLMDVSKATATKHLNKLKTEYPFIKKEVISRKYCYSIDLDMLENMGYK